MDIQLDHISTSGHLNLRLSQVIMTVTSNNGKNKHFETWE